MRQALTETKMPSPSLDHDTVSTSTSTSTPARERWENEGGSSRPPAPERTDPALTAEPFPALRVGELVLKDLELVRVVDKGTLGKYRVQQRGLGERGHVFLVTLFGATCSKVELMRSKKLGWRDYVTAMKRAIEREIGYWQNRGEPLPRGAQQEVVVTVRDTDFAPAAVRETNR